MKKTKSDSFAAFTMALYKNVVGYLFFVILAALIFMAAVSTSFIDKSEKIYFLPDSAIVNVAVAAAVLILGTLLCLYRRKRGESRFAALCDRIEEDGAFFKKLRKNLLIFCWVLVSIWVLCTQITPGADQNSTLAAARSIAEGKFAASDYINHIYLYNNLIGWTLLEYLIGRVFGSNNYLVYQLMNAGFAVLIIRELSLLGGHFGLSRVGQLFCILLSLVFAPIALYSSFVYGTLSGLFFSLLAVRMEIAFFESGKWHQALLCGLCAAFSVLLKMNYLIFFVGVLLYALVNIPGKKKKHLLIVAFLALSIAAQAKLPGYILGKMSGQDVPEGCSMWAWAAMGLQEGMNPGWYNNYNQMTLEQSGFDVEKQAAWAKTDLKLRIAELWQNKDYAREFFVRKTASQWNEPSFQSLWISMRDENSREGALRMTWPRALLSPAGNNSLTSVLNYLNFVILCGAMLYVLLCHSSGDFGKVMIFAMIFIGGFLFHLVWEAKGQYTMPYFVLLIPMAVQGYSTAAGRLAAPGGETARASVSCTTMGKTTVMRGILFLAAFVLLCYVFHGTLGGITGDTQAYLEYLTVAE